MGVYTKRGGIGEIGEQRRLIYNAERTFERGEFF